MIATPEKISASPDKISPTKVLIVEDEDYNRQLFYEYLEAEGFDPIVAASGSIGLELARQQKPEVIICKLIMSELDGYDVLNLLRQSPDTATIPFVILAEQWEKNSFRYAMELGADDYLVKPCGTHELTQAVLSQLKKRSILQQGYAVKLGKTPTSTVLKEIRSLENLDSEQGSSTFPFEESLNRVFNYIEANYWRSITLAEVAEDAGYSPAYLTSQVGSLTGKTVNRWIIERRMKAAKWYLKESNYTIEQIAHRIGYQSSCHFSRQFRKYHGVAPHERFHSSSARCRLSANRFLGLRFQLFHLLVQRILRFVMIEEEIQMFQRLAWVTLAQQGIAQLVAAHQVKGMQLGIDLQQGDRFLHVAQIEMTGGQHLAGGGAFEHLDGLLQHVNGLAQQPRLKVDGARVGEEGGIPGILAQHLGDEFHRFLAIPFRLTRGQGAGLRATLPDVQPLAGVAQSLLDPAGQHREVLREALRAMMRPLATRTQKSGRIELSKEDQERIAALGYAGTTNRF
ncbi:MAG: response regulator, partial [Cyanobacteriota bacterium]|nr:response regulator [Cyanobacteriota bacterium]